MSAAPSASAAKSPWGPAFGGWPSISASMAVFATVCAGVGRWSQTEPGLLSWLWACPFKALSGLPCFTCGITRVVLLLGEGEIRAALGLAPLPFFVLLGAWVAGGFHLFARLAKRTPPDEWIARWLVVRRVRLALVILFFGLWGYAMVRSILTGAP